MQHVAAHGEVDARVVEVEREAVAGLERQPVRERRIPRAGVVDVHLQHVDAGHPRRGVQAGEPRGNLTGAAAEVEDARAVRQAVALEVRALLRPDRFGLGREVAHHGFVGHLPGLRVQVHTPMIIAWGTPKPTSSSRRGRARIVARC